MEIGASSFGEWFISWRWLARHARTPSTTIRLSLYFLLDSSSVLLAVSLWARFGGLDCTPSCGREYCMCCCCIRTPTETGRVGPCVYPKTLRPAVSLFVALGLLWNVACMPDRQRPHRIPLSGCPDDGGRSVSTQQALLYLRERFAIAEQWAEMRRRAPVPQASCVLAAPAPPYAHELLTTKEEDQANQSKPADGSPMPPLLQFLAALGKGSVKRLLVEWWVGGDQQTPDT